MKQLTCEMCGSTDLIKQDGVFVCQTCGCKYSVEEAKRMMIEGTVDVSGSTVKIDNTASIKNYLELSANAYASGNGQSAFDYANKALEIIPNNPDAWIAKMKAIEYIGTLGDLKLMEVVEAGKNAISYATEDKKEEIEFSVYEYQLKRALDLLKIAMSKLQDTADIEATFKKLMAISILRAPGTALEVDSKVVQLYDRVASEALNLIALIPDVVIQKHHSLTKLLGECAKQYGYETDAVIKRYKIYGAELNESAKKIRSEKKTEIERRFNEAEKLLADKKRDDYWKEHAEEKALLLTEKESLESKIQELKERIESSKEKSVIAEIEGSINAAKKELGNLNGFDKLKGKGKPIQARINEYTKQLNDAKKQFDAYADPLNEEINNKQNRVLQITEELEKER